jgi:carboxymethylenebutenolidase
MGQAIELKAADGQSISAYEARPAGTPRGGVVVLQEIFGVTSHIREVADQYAGAGYYAVAPSLFDRVRPRAELDYSDIPGGLAMRDGLRPEDTLADIAAAVAAAARHGKVGVVGYCWGGTLAYVAACRLPIAAASSYYGGGLPKFVGQLPHCPVQFHFGDRDAHIPLSDVEAVRRACPQGEYYLYPADHGFNCTDRPMFHAVSALLALARTLGHFARHVG